MSNFLETENLTKVFSEGTEDVIAVKKMSLKLAEGEKLVIYGRSGSGKSTLLNLLAGLDTPSEGKIVFNGLDYSTNNSRLSDLRKQNMGFVYQFHYLLNDFNAIENIAMPLLMSGYKRKDALEKSMILLDNFGLKDRKDNYPSQLSGGEKQRVAIARALSNDPCLVFLDEPTGNLDKKTSNETISFLQKYLKDKKAAAIIATHDPDFETFGDSIKMMDSGEFI
tara:strand:+ start:4347 stop:5015 length:669 start_codon:yes stop_codon:yes gene_type:complete